MSGSTAVSDFLKLLLCFAGLCCAAEDSRWLPVSADELAMKDDAANRGAAAIILNREIEVNDQKGYSTEYVRIKVFTNEGRKYADVEIPYNKKTGQVEDIRARTVSPDGKSQDFTGQIFDKVLAKVKKVDIKTKSFTLPTVREGSIIEYTYTRRWHEKLPRYLQRPGDFILTDGRGFVTATFFLDEELFTRNLHIVVRPVHGGRLTWASKNIPKESDPITGADGSLDLRLQNIAALRAEEDTPPDNAFRPSIAFYYVAGPYVQAEFWFDYARSVGESVEKFVGDPKHLREAPAPSNPAGESGETVLQTLYARAQKIRNLGQGGASQEESSGDIRENRSADDVLKRGYGWPLEINLAFIALARAAGFDATLVLFASRDSSIFDRNIPDPEQLNGSLVRVHIASRDYYLDPATPLCPFGVLPWYETAVKAITASKSPTWVTIPTPETSEAVITRKLNAILDKSGTLRGELAVKFTGQDALELRTEACKRDERGRRKLLEETVRSWMPLGSTVTLSSFNGCNTAENPLRASLQVEVPGFAFATKRRLLVPMVLVGTTGSRLLEHGSRIHPVYFPYPHERVDEISIELPAGYSLEAAPKSANVSTPYGTYQLNATVSPGKLQSTRRTTKTAWLIAAEEFPSLWAFLTTMKVSDEAQIVFKSEAEISAR